MKKNRYMLQMMLLALLTLSACSVHTLTGNTMSDYTAEHLAPYILGSDDLEMACELGISMGGFLLSFERVMDTPPDEAGIATLLTAAQCSEQKAWEEELRGARALKLGQGSELRDAQISQMRAHGRAARRYYEAYRRMIRRYGEKCSDEWDHPDQLNVLLGMMAGILAVQNDRASNVSIGVPVDTTVKVARQSQCLDSDTWWGVPKALEAAVWLVVPGSAPSKATGDTLKNEAYTILKAQSKVGHTARVRLVDAIFATAARGLGDVETLKKIISEHAQSISSQPPAEKWRLLDLTASAQLRTMSDLIWTEERGHRTPPNEFGQFPMNPSSDVSTEEDDDLLDGLVDE